jgi:dihydropteroate synthase
MQQGAQIFRVHDVRAAVQTIRTITAIHGSPDT